MIRMECDSCGEAIDRDKDAFYGVDREGERSDPPADPVEAMNEADEQMLTAVISIGSGERDHHFCSAACLASWALHEQMEGQ